MSPRLGWPTVVDKVAAPIVHTAAVRIPAINTGATSGASTSRSFCAGVIPTASAACEIAGSIPCSPATAFRRIGSSAYSVNAINDGRKPSAGMPPPTNADRLSNSG
jgi:hypothetical protein